MTQSRALIEDWLPIAAIGVESRRENSTGKHPPPNRLHVWWARRPLVASRAAVLGSVLPVWSDEWPDEFLELFPTEAEYRDWFVDLLGIRGDPVAARERILVAKDKGIRLPKAYDGPRAFTLGPDSEQIDTLQRLLLYRWGTETPTVLDQTAGGGSIPFESIRFGLPTRANELNSVASFILKATLILPARFGPELANDIAIWGEIWANRVEERLKRYYPRRPGESIHAFLFARTVTCPETGKQVPLSPNWWLRKGTIPVAVKPIADSRADESQFEIQEGDSIDFDPSEGTVTYGKGLSIWTRNVIGADYIKAEAQAGRMGAQMYAIVCKTNKGLRFRSPEDTDLLGYKQAQSIMSSSFGRWKNEEIIPTENYPRVASDMRPHHYGMFRWSEFFSSRQLLSLGTALEELSKLGQELRIELDAQKASAVETYLAAAISKAINYNSILSSWHVSHQVIRSVFDRHDFSFKWSFAEFDTAHNLLPWSVSQISDAYQGVADLIEPSRQILFPSRPERAANLIKVNKGDAVDLPVQDDSIHAVVMDPPYYDNVQYAELSDFFYVWLKRTAGHLYPELFESELTDKASEAVKNKSRFVEFDKKNAEQLARQDYEAKMTNIFTEAHRVLRHDGVLTVMFNHKKVEAWDALGRSLIEGGFEILTSWPVHTESEHSLHQAKKAAAASTILLTCRKRSSGSDPVWWDDLKRKVRQVARDKAEEYTAAGVVGVDLYIATFGPVLSIISRQWPVFTSEVDSKTGEPLRLRPEDALDLARSEVADLRLRGLALGRSVEFDPVSDWYLLAWDAFPAEKFPYDEARKLAFAVGIDVESDLRRIRIVAKKGGSVVLQDPKARRVKYADPEVVTFERLIDAAHALMNAWREDGIAGAEAFLKRTRLNADPRFRSLLQALLNVIPRTKKNSSFIRPEAAALDAVTILFPDLKVPEASLPVSEPVQGSLDLAARGD